MIFSTGEYDGISSDLSVLVCYNGGDMHGPQIEERTVPNSTALALDIAHHLSDRSGKAVVVCEQPAVLAGLTKRQWIYLLRTIRRDYSATLDPQKRETLSEKREQLLSRQFSSKGTPEQLETSDTDVLFCTTEALRRYAPAACHTMYITHPIDNKTLHLITAWMSPEDSVIRYCVVAPMPKPRARRRSVDYRVVYGEG